MITQSTAAAVYFYLISSSSGTGLTGVGAEVAVQISKDGAAWASPSDGTVTEIGNGVYYLELDATDTATLGPLAIKVTHASAAQPWIDFTRIVAAETTTGLALSDANIQKIAESILRADFAGARAASGSHVDTLTKHSVLGALAWWANGWALSGSTITVKDEAGSTWYSVTVTTTEDTVNPIVGQTPVA